MKPAVEILKEFFIQRIILYGVIVFFSLFVIIPMGDLRTRFTDNHASHCVLYSDVEYLQTATYHYFKIRFGEQEVCEYNIAVSSVFCLFYPLAAGLIYFFLYRRDSKETKEENKLDLSHVLFLAHVLAEVGVGILMLVSACMISAGFKHTCDSFLTGLHTTPKMLQSCKDAQNFEDWRDYDGSNFYIALSVATAGSWFLFVAWLAQGILGVWKLCRLNVLPDVSAPIRSLKQRTEEKRKGGENNLWWLSGGNRKNEVNESGA